MIPQPLQSWQMKLRAFFPQIPIFKMKLYKPLSSVQQQQQLFFHLPKMNKIQAFGLDLKTIKKQYKFNNDTHAFQIVKVENNDGELVQYIVVGSCKGKIQCQRMNTQEQDKSLQKDELQVDSQKKQQTYSFTIQPQKKQQIYINDILSLPNNKIVNCFNNGTIAFHDLRRQKRILSLQNIHSNYTYKIRLIQDRLITCGHDRQICVIDLIKYTNTHSFYNKNSTWCAYPLNYNLIASVGLFNRVNLWDVRMKNICTTALLQNDESSFVTKFDQNSLVLGDGHILKTCDMRSMRCEGFTSQSMLESAENIIVTENGGYACGRRFEISRFDKVAQINTQDKCIKNIFYQVPNHGLVMHSFNYQDQIDDDQQDDQQEDFQLQGNMDQQQQWPDQQDSQDQIQ